MDTLINQETEYLSTVDGEDIECISIENLKGIIKRICSKYPNDQKLGEVIRQYAEE